MLVRLKTIIFKVSSLLKIAWCQFLHYFFFSSIIFFVIPYSN